MIKVKHKLSASRPRNPAFLKWLPYWMLGIFVAPSCLFGGEMPTTYDKTTIRYPSMFVGQIWAKSGESSTPVHESQEGQASARSRENSSSDLKTNPGNKGAATEKNSTPVKKNLSPAGAQRSPAVNKEAAQDSEAKKKLKQRRLKTVQALKGRNESAKASNQESPLPAAGKEIQKTSNEKTMQLKKTALSRGTGIATSRANYPGKNWHHKKELYDVECGQKLARVVVTYYFDKEETLLNSKVTPDAEWYHIYPGSLEERLYVELCHPSMY